MTGKNSEPSLYVLNITHILFLDNDIEKRCQVSNPLILGDTSMVLIMVGDPVHTFVVNNCERPLLYLDEHAQCTSSLMPFGCFNTCMPGNDTQRLPLGWMASPGVTWGPWCWMVTHSYQRWSFAGRIWLQELWPQILGPQSLGIISGEPQGVPWHLQVVALLKVQLPSAFWSQWPWGHWGWMWEPLVPPSPLFQPPP